MIRCMVPSDDLDTNATLCTRALTDGLTNILDLKTLWDEYGIDDSVIVSNSFQMLLSQLIDLQPFMSDFPHADIHQMISLDILHQVIKGTFKDHLVTWVGEYLVSVHGQSQGQSILDDIDWQSIILLTVALIVCSFPQSIATVPPFPGLCHFPHGWRFKQWMGDDSKALMKVCYQPFANFIN
jgi:hypothetical protein